MPRRKPDLEKYVWKDECIGLLKQVGRKAPGGDKGTRMTYEAVRAEINARHKVLVNMHTLRKWKHVYVSAEQMQPSMKLKKLMRSKENTINILMERARLYKQQLDRIKIDEKIEKQMNKLLDKTHKEIDLANQMLSDLKTDYFEMGIIERVPDKIEHSGNASFGFLGLERAVSTLQKKRNGDHNGDGNGDGNGGK